MRNERKSKDGVGTRMNRPARGQTNPLARMMVDPLLVKLRIQRCFQTFRAGPPIPSLQASHGKKPVLLFNGERVVAEIAVLRLFQEAGWDGVWVDSWRNEYRKSLPPKFCELPTHARKFLKRISGCKGWPNGCWDVFAWKNGRYLFVECKRKKEDSLRPGQMKWLYSALKLRIPEESFIVFEWDID